MTEVAPEGSAPQEDDVAPAEQQSSPSATAPTQDDDEGANDASGDGVTTGEDKEPIGSLAEEAPDADGNPAFHGGTDQPTPEPEPQTAYSEKPAPFTVI